MAKAPCARLMKFISPMVTARPTARMNSRNRQSIGTGALRTPGSSACPQRLSTIPRAAPHEASSRLSVSN